MIALAGALSSCGGGLPILAREIGRIMPSASDAPIGTEIDTTTVGTRTLEELVTDNTVKVRLSELHFRVAYVASFATPNYIPDKSSPVGSAFYGTFAIVFASVEDAETGFDFYRARLRGRAKDLTPLIPQALGQDTFAFRFSSLDDTPLPGVVMLFRVENALFSIVGAGNPSPDPAVTRALAEKIERRAEAAA